MGTRDFKTIMGAGRAALRSFAPAAVVLFVAAVLSSPAAAFPTTRSLHLASDDCWVHQPLDFLPRPDIVHLAQCGVEADVDVSLVGCSGGTCAILLEAVAWGNSSIAGNRALSVNAQQSSGPSARGPAAWRAGTARSWGPRRSRAKAPTLVVDGLVSDECQTFTLAAVYISQTYWARSADSSLFMVCVDAAGAPSVFAHT